MVIRNMKHRRTKQCTEKSHAVSFVCQHRHPPQNFYFPEYQSHPNGAKAIGKVVLSHWAADAVRDFYEAIGIDHLVDALHSDELIAKYGFDDTDFPTDGFAGFELIVDDLSRISEAALSLGAVQKKGQIILPPSNFFGVMAAAHFQNGQGATHFAVHFHIAHQQNRINHVWQRDDRSRFSVGDVRIFCQQHVGNVFTFQRINERVMDCPQFNGGLW